MPLLMFFLIIVAARAVWKQSKEDLARWRARPKGTRPRSGRRQVSDSDLGYWGHQLLHGFPTARHGFHDGWSRGREAHHKAKRAIAQNRAEHAEGRAELEPELADYRRRRSEALKEIERQRQAEEVGRAHDEALAENDRRDAVPAPAEAPAAGGLPDWIDPSWLEDEHSGDGDQQEAVMSAKSIWSPPYEKPPERDDPLPGEQPADGKKNQPDEVPDPEPAGVPAGHGNSEGDGPMTETTYQGVKNRMSAAQTAAEQFASDAEQSKALTEEHEEEAHAAKTWAQNTADEMQALEVDSATLNAMAEHLDAVDAAEKSAVALNEQMTHHKDAWQRVQETAENVTSQMDSSGHRALDEAHADAAGGGAQKEFYNQDATTV